MTGRTQLGIGIQPQIKQAKAWQSVGLYVCVCVSTIYVCTLNIFLNRTKATAVPK